MAAQFIQGALPNFHSLSAGKLKESYTVSSQNLTQYCEALTEKDIKSEAREGIIKLQKLSACSTPFYIEYVIIYISRKSKLTVIAMHLLLILSYFFFLIQMSFSFFVLC